MAELFILALFGHLVGDYFIQTKHMALHKGDKNTRGLIACSSHVLLYSLAVCAFLQTINPPVFLLIYIPHWIIDRWSLANKWLKLIRGRTFEAAYLSTEKYREFDIAFTSIVYTVTDNTMHLFSLWLLIKFAIL